MVCVRWFQEHLQELTEVMRQEVKGPITSRKFFKFGNNGVLQSKGKYSIPIKVAGKSWTMDLDVIQSDIPLLMKTMKMIIDMEDDTVLER